MNVPEWIVTAIAICIACFVLGILSGCAMTPNAQSGAGAGYVLTCGDKRIEVASQRDIEAAKITAKAGDCEVTAEITNASSAAAQSALAETVGRLVEKLP